MPPELLSAEVNDLRIALSVASGPVGSVGVTGRVSVSPFSPNGTETPAIAGGISVMFGASFGGDDPATIMFGVAPSFRVVGGDDATSQPVYLSQVLGGTPIDPSNDLKLYDPEHPDTGFGLIYSSQTANIGGAATDRFDAPLNVAQWLMPLYGFDGSDEALEASTSFSSSGCSPCAFQPDFSPTKRFTVPGGALTAAGSLIMPSPIGTAEDWATKCDPDPRRGGLPAGARVPRSTQPRVRG